MCAGPVTEEKLKKQGMWVGPTVRKDEAIERASAMVDRFHRLMMRTLRTLRDLRRYAPKVVHVDERNRPTGGELRAL